MAIKEIKRFFTVPAIKFIFIREAVVVVGGVEF